jgi:membrane associated rhomboid family serine protease
MSCAIGAFIFYNFIGAYELWKIKDQLIHLGYSMGELTGYLTDQIDFNIKSETDIPLIQSFMGKSYTPMVGASGAIFGIMAGFAFLFPNTELQMLFFPVPIKAKYLIGGYFLIELYLSFQQLQGDNVAHLAHVGGAVIGFIFVFFWNRNSKSFY